MLGGKGQNRARGRRKEVADGSEIELLCSEIFLKAKMLHETFVYVAAGLLHLFIPLYIISPFVLVTCNI
jgi:hypothetical protein